MFKKSVIALFILFAITQIAIAGEFHYRFYHYTIDDDPSTHGVLQPDYTLFETETTDLYVDITYIVIAQTFIVDGKPFSTVFSYHVFYSDGNYEHWSETIFYDN